MAENGREIWRWRIAFSFFTLSCLSLLFPPTKLLKDMSTNIYFPGNWSVISLGVIATSLIWIVYLLTWGNFFPLFRFPSPAFFICVEFVKQTYHSDSRRRLMFSFSLWFGGHSLILWVFIRQVGNFSYLNI